MLVGERVVHVLELVPYASAGVRVSISMLLSM